MEHMDKISSLNLADEISRMQLRDGLEQETALEAADLYRKFLALRLKFGTGLTPSKLIDTAWHQHMSDTRKYVEDCTDIFGEIMHHDPKVTGEKMESQFSHTKQLFKSEFGINLDLSPNADNRLGENCGA